MKILVIDGQGGRIGKMLVEKIRQDFPSLGLIALGTNSIATSTMPVSYTHLDVYKRQPSEGSNKGQTRYAFSPSCVFFAIHAYISSRFALPIK